MSSSEEYLDSLLKSLTEGGGTAGTESGMSIMQNTAGDLQNSDVAESVASDAADATMSMDDIEAMFTSMGMDAQEEEPAADEIAADDGMIVDELPLDDGMLSDELGMEETSLSDETLSENVGMEGQASDDFSLIDEMMSDELPSESEATMEDIALIDESASDELVLEESVEEGLAPDELVLEESVAEEPVPDGLVLEESGEEESMPDDLVLEESVEEESVLDDLVLEESGEEEPVPDDLVWEESGEEGSVADDLVLEESAEKESVLDDLALEESVEEESASDELSLDELGLGDLGLEELGLEEAGQETEEEQFALEESSEEESMVPEDTGEEDADLSALLASMGGDEDLSEINDLLEKSEQGVAVDDDMMAMLGGLTDTEDGEGEGEETFDFFSGEEKEEDESENIREITSEELEKREDPKAKKKEEKERKKREKKAKKKKGGESEQGDNADGENSDDLSNLLGDGGENEEPKKQGFFARFISFLLEEDEDGDSIEGDSEDVGVVIGNLSDENKELLEELNAEDKKNAKKKEKKEKADKKKNKKDKGKKKEGEAAADGEGEGDAKPKKPKKEKKKKEKSIEEELKLPVKKLSKKKVASVFLFCATIAACIIVLTMLLPPQMEKQEARVAFDRSQYEQVYALLYGKELSEEDEVLLIKSSVILKMQRKLDSYENYKKMDMQPEALNALIEGVSRYQNLRDDAASYNVGGEVADIYGQILTALSGDYGLSEADALDIISSGDDVTYSQRIRAVISGEFYGAEEPLPEGRQDVLPEEEEIIERLENINIAE